MVLLLQTLDLPMERSELQSSPAPSLGNHQQQSTSPTPITKTPPPLPKEPHLHRIHFVRRPLPPSSSTSSLPLLNNSINEGMLYAFGFCITFEGCDMVFHSSFFVSSRYKRIEDKHERSLDQSRSADVATT